MPFYRALLVVLSGSIAVQVLGLMRQLLIASAFGVDSQLDLYVLLFTLASVMALAFGAVLENAAVPVLVARKEAGDEEGFNAVASRTVAIGLVLSMALATSFVLIAVPFARLISGVASQFEPNLLMSLSMCFVPWVLLALPYQSMISILKARGEFYRLMWAEYLLTVVSVAVLFAWRPGIEAIPLSFVAGYVAASGFVLWHVWPVLRLRYHALKSAPPLEGRMLRLATVTQLSTLSSILDRFFLSLLPAGGLAAASYGQALVAQIASALAFRDVFLTPLSRSEGRTEKLERLLIGLLLVAIPLTLFLSVYAPAIVSIVFERGRFDAAASARLSEMLALQALCIPATVTLLPMYRVLQIENLGRNLAAIVVAQACFLGVLGYLLMIWWPMGVKGYLIAALATAYLSMFMGALMVGRAGYRLDYGRIGRYLGYTAVSALVGYSVATTVAPLGAQPGMIALAVHGIVAGVVYAICFLPLRRQIISILRGAFTVNRLAEG